MMYFSLLTIAGLLLLFENYECVRMLKVIPGIPTVTYCDKNYVQVLVFNIRRYSRRSDYMINLEFEVVTAVGRNVSASGYYYEYLHNEYRRTFVEWHGNLCTLILKDMLIGAMIRRVGFNVCPFPAAKYRLYNMSFDEEFPNIFPFEKGKGELVLRHEPSKKLILRLDLVMTFVQRIV